MDYHLTSRARWEKYAGVTQVAKPMMGRMQRRFSRPRLCDADIRAALLSRLRAEHSTDDSLVIEELGLWQGRARVDIAVINGSLSGFEIKSDRDTLTRLASQQAMYEQCFDAMTIVVGSKHLSSARNVLPRWWGIVEAVACADGVEFRPRRKARTNTRVCAEAVVRLVWKNEASEILRANGVMIDAESHTRHELWNLLLQKLSRRAIRDAVREKIKARGDWRSDPTLSRYGDSPQSRATSMNSHHHLSWLLLCESAHRPN